jgi:hypothetical protein
MMSDYILDELTDTHSLTVMEFPRDREYVAEVYIKDKGFIWYAVMRYQRLPTKSLIFRDTYAMHCKSPRPYKPAQLCDGSITAPALHLYNPLCKVMDIDPIALYNEAYDDHIFTHEQLAEILRFAEWQGVEVIYEWSQAVISKVIESLHEVNMHQLASIIEEKIQVC